jgi:hypothetical protein
MDQSKAAKMPSIAAQMYKEPQREDLKRLRRMLLERGKVGKNDG